MKKLFKLIFVISFFITTDITAQSIKIGEKQAIENSHMDFKTMYLYFVIDNLVEYDGHTFDNSKDDDPFIFHCDIINDVMIYRKSDTLHKCLYKYRDCGKKGCKIIHLEKVNDGIINTYPYGFGNSLKDVIW